MRPILAVCCLAILVFFSGCGDDGTTSSGGGAIELDLSITPEEGTIITDFSFDPGIGTGTAGDYECRWDWENDGTWDTEWSVAATATHRYSFWEGDEFDTIAVKVEVRKGSRSGIDSGRVVIDVRHGLVLRSFPVVPEHCSGLGTDGTHLWVSDWGAPGTARIYKYDPATEDTLYSIPAPDLWPCGLAWDGSHLWVAGLWIGRVDPLTGEVVASFEAVYTRTHAGLAWDGEILYFPSYFKEETTADGNIHKYLPDGTHLGFFQSPRGSLTPRGIAFDGEHLWSGITDTDTLFVLDPEDGDILWQTYPGAHTAKLAFMDGYMWALTYDEGYRLSRIVP
jgi:hypothetical protein